MNIAFSSIGSYPWNEDKDLKDIGLVIKFYDPKVKSSPAYFHVINEQLLFLSAIKYGMSFYELTENDLISILNDYKRELKKRTIIMNF
jgi:hypothetical protein